MLPYFHALLPPTLDHSPIDLDVYLESWGSPFHFELMWLGKDFAKLVPNRWGVMDGWMGFSLIQKLKIFKSKPKRC